MADQQTTQSKYRKKKKAEEQPSIQQNEVRIKGNQGHVKRYVDYACSLLEGRSLPEKTDADKRDEKKDENDESDQKQEEKPQKFDTIVLKATGRAINKAVTTAEVVKRRIPDLHQVTALETLEITDVWEPLEEGLKEVETKRRVASITITLSRNKEEIDEKSAGYQPPISSEAIKPFTMQTTRNPRRRGGGYRRGGGRGRGRGRGGPRGGGGMGGMRGRRRGGMRGGGRGGGGGFGRSPNRSSQRGGFGRGRGRGGRRGGRRGGGGFGGGGYGGNRRY